MNPSSASPSTAPADGPAQGVGGHRFVALDSWRGLCALAVALFHFPIAGPVASSALVRNSYLFVDFFFVLSGFVIATTYGHRLTDAASRITFLIRRFGRLWPLHATILAAFVLASLHNGQFGADERHSVPAIFTNLALIHGLGLHKDVTWNGPSWSISVEAALYVMFMALSAVRWRLGVYLGLIALSLVVLAFKAPQGMTSTFDYGIFRGMAGFFTGALVARLPRRVFGTAVELLTVAMVASFVVFADAKVLAPLVFGTAVYVFCGSRGLFNRALNLRPIVKLGEWSYSIYMVHAAVIAVIWAAAPRLGLHGDGHRLAGASALESSLYAAGYLLVVIALSACTYGLVESPGRRVFNRLSQRTAPQRAIA